VITVRLLYDPTWEAMQLHMYDSPGGIFKHDTRWILLSLCLT
jgi:hypothetical protein